MEQAATSFGHWLKLRRIACDLTRAELADRIGCATETMRKLERNQRRPSKAFAERLATTLGLPEDERAAFVRFARAEHNREDIGADAPGERLASTVDLPYDALPIPLTTLLGRDEEMAALRAMLFQGNLRLLTLIGPPGVGKTRLALAIAHDVQAGLGAGAAFVPLASLADPELLVPTIARRLGVREVPGRPLLELVVDHLADGHVLLILDNFEQLIIAAPQVVELLQSTRALTIMVTSRIALHIAGEYVFPVNPLALPALAPSPSISELADVASVQLFVQRAEAVNPRFVLSGAHARVIAEICVRLDGLPLALELAAARITIFTPQELLQRLRKPLDLLAGHRRDSTARQQTLRGALSWSYHLLNQDEQLILRILGVFSGGCTFAALEAVTGSGLESPLVDGVAGLVANSLLVISDDAGESRLHMRQLIHEYAVERLAAHGEEDIVYRRHAVYFLALAEQAAPELTSLGMRSAADRLEAEHDNLRAAMEWCLAVERELAGQLAAVLWQFWAIRAYRDEGRRWLDRVLAQHAALSTATYAAVLNAAAQLARDQGDVPRTIQLFEDHLALRRQLGEPRDIGHALNDLGFVLGYRGLYPRGLALLEQALTLLASVGERSGVATAQSNRGRILLMMGDNVEHSISLLEQARATFAEIDDIRGTLITTFYLALAYAQDGRLADAMATMRQDLLLAQRCEERVGRTYALIGIGILWIRLQGWYRGVVIISAGERLREVHDIPDDPTHGVAAADACARANLPAETFNAATVAGRALRLEQALTYALEEAAENGSPVARNIGVNAGVPC